MVALIQSIRLTHKINKHTGIMAKLMDLSAEMHTMIAECLLAPDKDPADLIGVSSISHYWKAIILFVLKREETDPVASRLRARMGEIKVAMALRRGSPEQERSWHMVKLDNSSRGVSRDIASC